MSKLKYTSPGVGYLDTRYLLLDGSNRPMTGGLTIQPTTDTLTALVVNDTDSNNVLTVDTINNRVGVDELRALSASGLKLYEDGGKGIFVEDSTGNVGIGTTTPSERLHVFNSGGHSKLEVSSDTDNATIFVNAPADEASYIAFETAGVEDWQLRRAINETDFTIFEATNSTIKLRIEKGTSGDISLNESAGNVGIGVTDPDTRLEIFNAGNQLKLSFDATDNAIFEVDTNGDLTIIPSGSNFIIPDAKNIALNTTTGSKLGTATGQKLGFWGITPVVQQVLATGGGATVDNVISLLQTLGICKQA